jgi:hypothetical protein
MTYRKHFIEYIINNKLFKQSIRNWADENQNLFPEYSFKNKQADFPTSHFIANRLVKRYHFQRIENDLEVIIKNTNRNFHF